MAKISIRNALVALAVGCVVVGLGLTVFSLIKGNWFSAATYLLVGLLAAFFWLPDLIQKTAPPPEWKAGCMLAVLLGVLAVFNEHSAFDMDRQEGHSQALAAFANIKLYCRPMSPELHVLMQEGLKACSFQSYVAMADAVRQLQNAQRLGPTLSIIDGVRLAAKKPDGDWCAETYLVTRHLCPLAFAGMNKKAVVALEKKLD